MEGFYAQYVDSVDRILREVTVTDQQGRVIEIEAALEMLRADVLRVREHGARMYFCGNGASAAMASHMASDWLKSARVRTSTFTDVASVTAFANDNGYENVFADPIQLVGTPNDMLVVISSSGESPSIVSAIGAARERQMQTVSFTGFKPANRARQLGDLNVYVAAHTYGHIESAHQVILHAWLDHFLASLRPSLNAT